MPGAPVPWVPVPERCVPCSGQGSIPQRCQMCCLCCQASTVLLLPNNPRFCSQIIPASAPTAQFYPEFCWCSGFSIEWCSTSRDVWQKPSKPEEKNVEKGVQACVDKGLSCPCPCPCPAAHTISPSRPSLWQLTELRSPHHTSAYLPRYHRGSTTFKPLYFQS